MKKNLLKNIEYSKTIKLKVKILEIEKDIPDNVLDDFEEWLLYKGIELGIGRHDVFYSINNNYIDDINIYIDVKMI